MEEPLRRVARPASPAVDKRRERLEMKAVGPWAGLVWQRTDVALHGCAYRWKCHDRLMIDSSNLEAYGAVRLLVRPAG